MPAAISTFPSFRSTATWNDRRFPIGSVTRKVPTAPVVCLAGASVAEMEPSAGAGAAGLALQAMATAPQMSPATITEALLMLNLLVVVRTVDRPRTRIPWASSLD